MKDAVYEKLIERFGRESIYMDLASNPIGSDFQMILQDSLEKCVVEIVVIGKHWIDMVDTEKGSRRIDDPKDYVRREIEEALKRQIALIPVLIDGAPMPRSNQLPPTISQLANYQGIQIDRGERFYTDVEKLLVSIDEILHMRTIQN